MYKHLSLKTNFKFATYSNTYNSNLPKAYNNGLSFQCGETLVQFWLNGPAYKFIQPNTMLTKTFKALTIRTIKSNEKYVRGSKWISASLDLNGYSKLLYWDFTKGKYQVINKQSEVEIRRDNQTSGYDFKIKNQERKVEFTLSPSSFDITIKTMEQVLTPMYGLHDFYQVSCKNLLERLENDDIQFENQETSDSIFSL